MKRSMDGMNWQAQQAFERGNEHAEQLRREASVQRGLGSRPFPTTVPFLLLFAWGRGVARAVFTRPRLPSLGDSSGDRTTPPVAR